MFASLTLAPSKVFYAVARFICWLVLRLWCRLRVVGVERVPTRGPYLVAANHVSYVDPPVVGVALPHQVRFIAKDELFRLPVLAPLMRWLRTIPIDLTNPQALNRKVLTQAVHLLKAGERLAMFPEGGRKESGQVEPAKLGIAFIALHARVSIVPVAIFGTVEVLPRGAKMLRRKPISVRIGAPISVASQALHVERASYGRLAAQVTAAIAQLQEQGPVTQKRENPPTREAS